MGIRPRNRNQEEILIMGKKKRYFYDHHLNRPKEEKKKHNSVSSPIPPQRNDVKLYDHDVAYIFKIDFHTLHYWKCAWGLPHKTERCGEQLVHFFWLSELKKWSQIKHQPIFKSVRHKLNLVNLNSFYDKSLSSTCPFHSPCSCNKSQ